MSKTAVAFLALLMVVAGSTALIFAVRARDVVELPEYHREPDDTAPPAEPLEDFQLTSQSGAEFNSATLEGEIWIASFFFASCPGTCRSQNQQVAALQQAYGEQGVKFVAISVDPASDTPAKLNDYAQLFDAQPNQWYFLTDTSRKIDYTRRIGQDIFKVPVTTQGHADTLILVGRTGKIHDYYNWKKPERMVELRKDIDAMLAGEMPTKDTSDQQVDTQSGDLSTGEGPEIKPAESEAKKPAEKQAADSAVDSEVANEGNQTE